MPIYEYICNKCKNVTEILEKINEKNNHICSICKTTTLEKKISASHFKLKGKGWYKTDYKKNQNKEE
ncbi:MAG TPA: FmdB family zinc ribbon protein [Candidatus Azoamicus sp.]